MQAYLPGAGWVDFDPTNSIVGNRNLIRVAVAWDQRNALPLWGTFIGPASAFRSMHVEVSVIETAAGVRRAAHSPRQRRAHSADQPEGGPTSLRVPDGRAASRGDHR